MLDRQMKLCLPFAKLSRPPFIVPRARELTTTSEEVKNSFERTNSLCIIHHSSPNTSDITCLITSMRALDGLI
jgi:hypothetical protein